MTNRCRSKTLWALSAVVVLSAAACGSSDNVATEQETDTSTTTTAAAVDTATTTVAAAPDGAGEGGPSFGSFNAELAAEMAGSEETGPFFMINLIDFRDQAEYADGRETDLTGRQANDLYGETGVQELFEGGMRPAFSGNVAPEQVSPPDPAWEQVAIARYPSYADFFALTSNPVFQEGAEHKDAGVETSSVIVTNRVVDAPPAAELPAGDAPVVLFELYSHAGTGTTDRPDSLTAYLDGIEPLATTNGGVALGTYEVVGTLIGDGREWDEAHLWYFPDRASLDALLDDPELAELSSARDEDLEDLYELTLDGITIEPMGREP
jgi:hypothetical protein